MINPQTYYTVQGWMRSDLGLKDKELTVYAIIYGFSQDGNSEYSGSARYLAEWIGCSRSTIMEVLKRLVEKGLLKKQDYYQNGVCFCKYTAVTALPQPGQGVQNSDRGVSENQTGGVQNSDRGCPKTGHNNTRDKDRDNNRNIYIGDADASPAPPAEKENDKKVKHKHGEYQNVLLTDEELAKLQQLFPLDLPARIERLSGYIAQSGKKYKSHYATIRNWASRDAKQQPAPAPRGRYAGQVGPNGIAIDPNMNDLDGIF